MSPNGVNLNQMTATILKKLHKGESISDRELIVAIDKLSDIIDFMNVAGKEFYFVRRCLIEDLHMLEEFKVARAG